MQYTDSEILALIKDPDTVEKGFRLFMTTYQEKLYWVIRRITGNHEDTDDVLQNSFIKAYKSIHGFEERSSLYTWIYKIAINETYTFKKSQSSKATEDIDKHSIFLAGQSEADIDADETEIKLQKAIDQLPDKQKQVFNLRYYDEMSYLDMSKLMATSEGALKASYHHALKKIETYLLA
jgi:RNA polymerase sigma-70 factor (ECF subfamily)